MCVLSARYNAEIRSPVVEFIAIDVINLETVAILKPKQMTMQDGWPDVIPRPCPVAAMCITLRA